MSFKFKFKKEYIAPWEQAFDKVLTPLEHFIHRQTTSGVLLMLCAMLALYLANSEWNGAYQHILHLPFKLVCLDLNYPNQSIIGSMMD